MKITFLINNLGTGGAEKVVKTLKKELESRKHKVTIITFKNTGLAMLGELPFHVLKVRKHIKKDKPDIVVSFLELSNFANILANKNAVISWRISWDYYKGLKGAFYKFVMNALYPRAKLIICNSKENEADAMTRFKVLTETILNPLDLDEVIEKCGEELPTMPRVLFQKLKEDKVKIFMTVGRLDEQKQFDKMIKEWDDELGFLFIIGDGPERDKLLKLAEKRHIHFLGKQDNVYKYLQHADYFIYRSRAEGYPNVFIEANACGVPIITTNFKTGAREIVLGDLREMYGLDLEYGPNGVVHGSSLTCLKWLDYGKVKSDPSYAAENHDVKMVTDKWVEVLDKWKTKH